MNRTLSLLSIVLLAGAAGACSDDGVSGGDPLVTTTTEPAGANCEFGGTVIASGLDDNGDGVLSDDEIDATSYVCAGDVPDEPFTPVLTDVVVEPAGENCETGGLAINTGSDGDGDGSLSEDEVASTSYICFDNGPAAPAAPVLTTYADEPAGANCEFGGVLANSGADDNANDSLDEDEVDSSAYICFPDVGDGSGGGSPPALLSVTEYAGRANAGCEGGYVVTTLGFDANDDAALGEDEVSTTIISCNAMPEFEASLSTVVEDCGEDVTIATLPIDYDGTIEALTVEVLSSGSELEVSIDDEGLVTIESGEHAAGAFLLLTAIDNFGAESTVLLRVRFRGTGCVPSDTFYGVEPGTCVEVDVDDIAGDDRGAVTLIADGLLYNGDEGLIRADRDLGNVTLITRDKVDTLVADPTTGELYSVWSSTFEFNSLQTSDGDLASCCVLRPFDQLARLDSTTFEVIDTLDLADDVYANSEGDAYEVITDGGTIDFRPRKTALGMTETTLVVGTVGFDDTNFRDMLYFRVFSRETGEVLSSYFANEDDTVGFYSRYWEDQETFMLNFYTYATDTGEVMTYREGDNEWVEINVRTGEFMYLSTNFADSCDTDSFMLSADGSTVYFHSEEGCFAPGIYESIGYCDALAFENDGLLDDSGTFGDR